MCCRGHLFGSFVSAECVAFYDQVSDFFVYMSMAWLQPRIFLVLDWLVYIMVTIASQETDKIFYLSIYLQVLY